MTTLRSSAGRKVAMSRVTVVVIFAVALIGLATMAVADDLNGGGTH